MISIVIRRERCGSERELTQIKKIPRPTEESSFESDAAEHRKSNDEPFLLNMRFKIVKMGVISYFSLLRPLILRGKY